MEDNDEEKEVQGRSSVATNTGDWCDRETEELPLTRVQYFKLVTALTRYVRTNKKDGNCLKASSYKPGFTSQARCCDCYTVNE
jgi:hypothetical protein